MTDTLPPPSGSRPTEGLLLKLAAVAKDAPHSVVKRVEEIAFNLQLGLEPSLLADEIGLLAIFTSEDAEDWNEALRWAEGSDGADADALRKRAHHYGRLERVLRGEEMSGG